MARRRATVGGALAAALVLAVEPAAAQSINRALIQNLNRQLLYVAAPLAILVETILFYAVWRYRDNHDPTPTKENRSLEITWTLATAIVLLFVGFASFNVLLSPYISPSYGDASVQTNASEQALQGAVVPDDPDAIEVEVVAYRWGWEFVYPEANVSTQNTSVIPANTDVYYHITAREVIHAFHAPELGLKQDAIPGQYNTIRTSVGATGEYRVYCSEFCGAGHSRMYANVTVRSEERYRAWLDEQRSGNATGSADSSNATSSQRAAQRAPVQVGDDGRSSTSHAPAEPATAARP
ncbi:cytochrome c oxidase subunit II [Halococcus agarilyticus]|uniref:cytochrome c oxidase subunit II n=1 Tax=Halococcus agarilyticus TaxID=1232219 RepID=UPI0009AE959F|nr:cytochrome c oxidase subunit II [Halococcus agarilyticus]